jgi:APA family basic amino acid/polyamine antiporter
LALGPTGANLVAVAVALSTLGFLSNQILISPRIYFDMAADGLFFKQLAYVHPVTRAPVVAIALQAVVAIALTTWGRYDQILTYVVSMDFVFFSFAVLAVFRLHRARGDAAYRIRIPLHPYSTVVFLVVNVALYASAFYSDWRTTSIGASILLSGIPAYILFARGVNYRLTRKDRATRAAETGIR